MIMNCSAYVLPSGRQLYRDDYEPIYNEVVEVLRKYDMTICDAKETLERIRADLGFDYKL